MCDHLFRVLITTLLLVAASAACIGEDAPKDLESTDDAHPLNIPGQTLGGMQFWGEVAFFRGWRIQQHVSTRHHRLLDPDNVRRAWGDCQDCQSALAEIRKGQNLTPMSGKACILIHGIGRSSRSMEPLAGPLKKAGYTVVPFEYPSTRIPIQDSAAYLRQVIASLDGIDQIDFVVHSMGGLVLRASLAPPAAAQDAPLDPRLHRAVMLGVPNNGARMADLVQDQKLFQLLYGEAGGQLASATNDTIKNLPTPPFEFAIIAGGRGNLLGYNPAILGDDDGTVLVSETQLPGAADFLKTPVLHSLMMSDPVVIDATVRFLHAGHLRSNGKRTPLAPVAIGADSEPEIPPAPPLPTSSTDPSP
jgi:pimeloyl-ACP methyl ester carboxylesterase